MIFHKDIFENNFVFIFLPVTPTYEAVNLPLTLKFEYISNSERQTKICGKNGFYIFILGRYGRRL